MTIGRTATATSGMSAGENRIEVSLYAVLSSPMVLSFDLGGKIPDILFNREVVAINQDPDVISASLAYQGQWAYDC